MKTFTAAGFTGDKIQVANQAQNRGASFQDVYGNTNQNLAEEADAGTL